MEKVNTKIIVIIATLAIAVCSFTFIGNWASNAGTYTKSIEALNETKADALEITAVATASAAVLAAIPGDATTPLANKLMDVAGYTVVVFTAIVLEKYLMTLTGTLAFKILIPLACILILVACFVGAEEKRRVAYRFAARLVIVGLLLWALVPTSIKVTDCIKKTYTNTSEVSVTTEDVEEKAEDNSEKVATEKTSETYAEGSLLDKAKGLFGKAKANVSQITENSKKKINEKIEEFQEILEKLMEQLAIMIVTTCVIPICVLLLGVWIIKVIMGVGIPVSVKMPKASSILKKSDLESKE